MQVLIAEENIQHRMWLANKLIGLSYSVIEALDEQNVLKICKDKCPDMLFISSKLSGVSGIDLIYKVRQLGGSAVWNTIILLPTEDSSDLDLQKGLDSGADDFLLTPINNFQLLYKLAAAKRHLDLKNEIFQMAHDLAITTRSLENVNKQDVMTGLCEVNTFYRNLEIEWFKAKKEKYHVVLILLNLDYFRAYNEIYGADLGDQTIKKVANALKQGVPVEANHNIARTAGETFAIFLPKKDLQFGIKLANNLIKLIYDLSIPHKGSACSNVLTISAGVAVNNNTTDNFLELVENADFALYTAKHTGRNKVYAAND
jgi:diguanylate cyclase (GGDEF)-like protein